MLIVGQDRAQIGKLKEELVESFDMKDLSPAKQILGMEITRDRKIEDCGCHKKDMLNEFLNDLT